MKQEVTRLKQSLQLMMERERKLRAELQMLRHLLFAFEESETSEHSEHHKQSIHQK